MILFYDHLVDKTQILIHINSLDAPNNQKGQLRQLVDDIIFQGVIDLILSHLPRKHHHTFLSNFHQAPYDPELIIYLRTNAHPEIEIKIQNHSQVLVKKIKKDLGFTRQHTIVG